MRLNFESVNFSRQITYLGHTINENGFQKNLEKVKAILQAERPENVNQLRSFISMANYYNRFIPRLAEKLNHWKNYNKKERNLLGPKN